MNVARVESGTSKTNNFWDLAGGQTNNDGSLRVGNSMSSLLLSGTFGTLTSRDGVVKVCSFDLQARAQVQTIS